MAFQKATKSKSLLRCGIYGPSGSGKTFTSLRLAKGLANDKAIALLDTERGSASKYADRFNFDVMELVDYSIDAYCDAIKLAEKSGYGVLIIDSLSHAWQELRNEVDRISQTKFRGNSWSAWSQGTPQQQRLVDTILSYGGHIISTMRSKTEWATADVNGKKTPQRVGLAPEQRSGLEYEFDLLLELSTDHIAQVVKDRTGKFQDKILTKPGEDFGGELLRWLSEGCDATPKQQPVAAVVVPEVVERPGAVAIHEAIDRAKTVDELVKASLAAKSLPEDEKNRVRAHYRARQAELKKERV